ncbi:transcriptional activator MN1-like isoform X3 [Aricia agestis]|uniref:transcriptional activator MN1-like isoform X3 n=1 Tax=Aricia agestis TaxID=91739 RepID=UPI001C20417C|nr:transcriptional activator MN1-like isoform X3 [Aricia agestis]
MDAAADPLRTVRPEEGDEKPKAAESQDDGYETSNSGEARRKPSSAEGSPAPPRTPPPEPAFEPLMQRPFPSPYRHFEQPAPPAPPPPHDEPYQHQHFPFPKYPQDPYAFKRDADVPYDMSQHQIHQYGPPKRDDDMYNGVKRECEDPYSFVEEEAMCAMLGQHHMPHMQHHDPHHHMQMHPQQMMLNQPKKRGRKKKIKDENGMEIKVEPGMEGALVARPIKERKKHDRFNGMSEEEVSRRTLPDHLAENLDIIIIGINPGLFAAYKGHHYAGPGNHFWKCLYLSGLTREQMSADEDYKLLNFGIGFTNMVARPTKGSADLTRREIKEGSAILLEKLQTFRPKVAVFNGKLIYEVFSGKKDFCFGKQPDTIAGTNTYMWVMPSSSARCAQLPRAADKVPFYAALKKFRDYLNGLQPHVDEAELIFPDTTGRRPQEEMEIRSGLNSRLTMEPEPGDTIILEDGTEVPLKKKRGRPKKVKLENGETAPPVPRAPRQPRPPPVLDPNGELPPKKKRGRPKKIRPEEQQFLMQQQQQQQQQANSMIQPQLSLSQLPHEQQFLHGEFPQQMASPIPQSMMYGVQHQQMPDGSPYYQPNNAGGMDSPLEVGGGGGGLLSRGYASPGGAGAAGYASSPRAVYASPRSQPYSPTPQRLAATPQPQHQDLSAPQQFPSSPAAFSAPSPPRAPYSSPGVGGVGNVGGVGVGNVGNVGGVGSRSFAARSPLYASSPAAYRQQPSPAAQPRFSHEMPFSRDATPQAQSAPYARSPAPAGVVGVVGGGSTPFPAASPAGALHSYTPSPAHTPYSHHSSPAPTYTESHHFSNQGAGGGSGGGSGGFSTELSSDIGAAISSPGPVSPGMAALDFEPPRSDHSPMGSTDMHPGSNSNSSLSDYNKQQSNPGGAELSPAAGGGAVGGAFGGAMYDEGRLQYQDKPDYHYQQEQAPGVAESPRLDQMHQHPSMYPSNYNRSTPTGEEDSNFGRAPPFRTLSEHAPGSPGEYGNTGEGGTPKGKSQDVASKSLSGLESLVDQIPSIAEGGAGAGAGPAPSGGDPAPPAPLPDYAPALYPPYPAYGAPTYGNNGYGGPFVGYGGGWGTQLMRPAPGYLPDWQYGYAPGVAPPYAAYNAPYYNGYAPPPAHHQQTHYLSAPPLLELHKSGEHAPAVPSVPSVGFGGFC